jgi:hypothetical protein
LRSEVVGVVLAVLVIGTFGLGYFEGIGNGQASTRTLTVTTVVTTSAAHSSPTAEMCTIMDPSKGVSIRVTNGTEPVADTSITVQDFSGCSGGVPVVVAHYDVMTNSTGWASMCSTYDGTCSMTIHYSGRDYPLSVFLTPGVLTDVYYDLSNGNETMRASA